MFKYGDDQEDYVKLSLFPSSLTGEALAWFEDLEENSIETWAQLKEAFVSEFLSPVLARKLKKDVRDLRQEEEETIPQAWKRLKKMLKKCHGHGIERDEIIEIFYDGLSEQSQKELDLAGGGIFLYKTTNTAYKMMDDMVRVSLTRNTISKDRRSRRTVARAESSGSNLDVIAEIRALSKQVDEKLSHVETHFGRMEKDIKVVASGCDHCGGLHYSEDCESIVREDANYAQNQYQGPFRQEGGFQNRNQGNFRPGFKSNTNNFQNRYPRNYQNYQNQPRTSHDESTNHPQPNRDDEITLSTVNKTINNFITTQNTTNERLFSKFTYIKNVMETGQKNQQASITDLEKKLDRLSNNNRPTGTLPSNTQQNPRPTQSGARPSNSNSNSNQKYQPPPARNEHVNAISTRADNIYGTNVTKVDPSDSVKDVPEQVNDNNDSENESMDEEIEADPKPIEKTPTISTEPAAKPPLKAYKPKIPYPQRLRKEKMAAKYSKFIEMIKTIRINVPLVDVLAGMPNYAKFIKELLSNKDKLEEISATFLNEECTTILQNQIPPKLDDPGNFIITCSFEKLMTCDALADLGASINLMPHSLYAKLSLGALKPTKMSIRLADHSFQYPLGIAENMMIEVGHFSS
uniref:uncharacterized protein LOC122597019 n=1 Tax=Erigeron canadensis TaxID=72917 RepID=UPI001CB9ADF2|nr:uncharacterized protein LOC122597019 [Erigeron canadensis]